MSHVNGTFLSSVLFPRKKAPYRKIGSVENFFLFLFLVWRCWRDILGMNRDTMDGCMRLVIFKTQQKFFFPSFHFSKKNLSSMKVADVFVYPD